MIIKLLNGKHPPEVIAAAGHCGLPLHSLIDHLNATDPFMLQAAVTGTSRTITWKPEAADDFRKMMLTKQGDGTFSVNQLWAQKDGEAQIGWALVVRRLGWSEFSEQVPQVLTKSPDSRLQLLGLQWLAELGDKKRIGDVESVAARASSRQVFEAALAVLDSLSEQHKRDPRAESAGEAFVSMAIDNDTFDSGIRRFALRSLRPDHPILTAEKLSNLLSDKHESIRLEAIRTIRVRPDVERWTQLREDRFKLPTVIARAL